MAVRGVRGAIVVASNSPEEIIGGTAKLLTAMIEQNCINVEDMAAIIFSVTPDLNSAFPATAARQMGLTMVPLFGTCEADVEGAPGRCIRVLLLINTDKKLCDIKHVYLGEARDLRPDLTQE
ncbi:MAG TPA: chorismate mutase [Firmicutes bacterium]|nr:chorismate mutase [Bacillota bacterium]